MEIPWKFEMVEFSGLPHISKEFPGRSILTILLGYFLVKYSNIRLHISKIFHPEIFNYASSETALLMLLILNSPSLPLEGWSETRTSNQTGSAAEVLESPQTRSTITSAASQDVLSSRNPAFSQLYIMESACLHLGADLSHADIEECDTGVVAVCPWHRCTLNPRCLCCKIPYAT